MVSLKAQLLATILLTSEVYSQLAGCGNPQPQRCAPATPSIIPGGQFIVPAIIKPLIPACKPEAAAQAAPKKQASANSCPPVPSADDDDDDSELDKLLYLLISNIIESKKGSAKKQSNVCDGKASASACACDAYDACACGYGDDYEYCSYSAPGVYSSSNSGGGDGYCPEINVYIRQYEDC